MLAAENPYMLPAVLLGGAVYLGLSVTTDLSIVVRVGVLVGLAIVAPIGLNTVVRAVRGGSPSAADEESDRVGETTDSPVSGEGSASAVDEGEDLHCLRVKTGHSGRQPSRGQRAQSPAPAPGDRGRPTAAPQSASDGRSTRRHRR